MFQAEMSSGHQVVFLASRMTCTFGYQVRANPERREEAESQASAGDR